MSAERKYDWAGWLSRGQLTLTAGVDYCCSTDSMIQQMRNWLAQNLPGTHVKVIRHANGFTALTMRVDAKRWNRRPKKDAATT